MNTEPHTPHPHRGNPPAPAPPDAPQGATVGAGASPASGEPGVSLDIQDILAILPHRYPLLLVDRVLSLEPGRRAMGIKCVSANEPYFQGHFPGRPIMPGVLILEAMAQVGAVAVLAVPENRGKLALFAGADRVRWRRPVIPGDCLEIQVEIVAARGAVGKGRAVARVGGELAAEAELTFALRSP